MKEIYFIIGGLITGILVGIFIFIALSDATWDTDGEDYFHGRVVPPEDFDKENTLQDRINRRVKEDKEWAEKQSHDASRVFPNEDIDNG